MKRISDYRKVVSEEEKRLLERHFTGYLMVGKAGIDAENFSRIYRKQEEESDMGTKVVFLNEVILFPESPEQELTHDLLTILHVFSCRLHELRKYRTDIKNELHARVQNITHSCEPPVKILLQRFGEVTVASIRESDAKPVQCSDSFLGDRAW